MAGVASVLLDTFSIKSTKLYLRPLLCLEQKVLLETKCFSLMLLILQAYHTDLALNASVFLTLA